ncbi:HNH endonuclease [Streptomyces mirabilis]|uniref:HNH endonuclease n=1 Tax=Streptomyces mirabilis TaxID=68239 RepID=UPI0033BE18DE
MAVSKRLRYEILRRDQHTCRYCGASAPAVPLRVDHVTPVALGGADTPDNLVTSCEPCNSGKSSATVDSAVVANVSDDALRWAAAMTQAAANLQELEKPKDEYRDAFLSEWNRWHVGKDEAKKVELPVDWKQAMDRFRVAGIPAWMWADIVDIGMANQKVKPDNTFRYCCGIAWNKVTALQAEARRIVGAATPDGVAGGALVLAALDVWASERADEITSEARSSFLASIEALREKEEAHRVLMGAQLAAWCGESDAAGALAANDHDEIFHQWWNSWLGKVGDYPPENRMTRMRAQIDTLLAAGVYRGRIMRAAIYAGSHQSGLLHFGLDEDERASIGVTEYISVAVEAWRDAFYVSAARWPTDAERIAFLDALQRTAADGDIYIADIYAAAAAAGVYQDPEISTCLTRHLSVFEIASRPLGSAA